MRLDLGVINFLSMKNENLGASIIKKSNRYFGQVQIIFQAALILYIAAICIALRNMSQKIQSGNQTLDLSVSRRSLCHLSYHATVRYLNTHISKPT